MSYTIYSLKLYAGLNVYYETHGHYININFS